MGEKHFDRPKRSLGRRLLLGASTLFSVGLIGYLALAIWLQNAAPVLRIDYLALLQADALRVPEDQRAWLVYERVGRRMGGDDWSSSLNKEVSGDGKTAFLAGNRDNIGEMRQAARTMPLGFVRQRSNIDEPLLKLIEVNPLKHLRLICLVFIADSESAASVGDLPRALDNVHATFGLARQLGNRGTVIDCLVAVGIRSAGIEQAAKLLHDHAPGLTQAQLVELDAELAKPRVAADLLTLDGERLIFRDLIQRMYTDDGGGGGGGGGGRGAGGRVVNIGAAFNTPATAPSLGSFFARPVIAMIMPTRRDMVATYDRLTGDIDKSLRAPMRDMDWTPHLVELNRLQGGLNQVRYSLPVNLAAPLQRASISAERTLAAADGLRVAIAAERYRRDHAGFPPTIDALVPRYLPEIPADRITGDPLKLNTTQGKLVVYSVGADRKDDLGRPAHRADGTWDPRAGELNPQPIPDGDWRLYPPQTQHPKP
jgi:hypothetical protein